MGYDRNDVTIEDGYVYNGDKTRLLSVPLDLQGTYTVPEAVTAIGRHAFARCDLLTSLEMTESMKEIGEEAFLDCTSLKSVALGSSVTTIAHRAFMGCTSLPSIQIVPSVTTIGNETFKNCIALSSIEIGPTVTGLDYGAFKAIEGIPTESDDTPTARLSFRLPLVWSSDNEDVATVTKKGVVTATKQGEATITASVYGHPELTDTHHVIVVQNITSGTLDVRTEKMGVSVRPGAIIVENVADGETVNLFTADGVLQASQKSFGEPVELPTIAGKIYIVSVNGFALKVIGK